MPLRELVPLSIVIRLAAAALLGGLIGLDREMKNRPAGLRTYMLVCMGSCLIMMTNQYIYHFVQQGDPTRLGAQVVSGIGFLGAGTIVVTRRNHIKGLTTAAGLWAAAGVGLALGVGFYEAALAAGLAIFLILTVLQRLDSKMRSRSRTADLYIEMSDSLSLGALIRELRGLNVRIDEVQLDQGGVLEENVRALLVTLKLPKRSDRDALIDSIRKINGVILLEEL